MKITKNIKHLFNKLLSRRAGIKKASASWLFPGVGNLADNAADKSFDLFILAVLKEALLETLTGHCRFNQLWIDSAQGVEIVLFNHRGLNLVQNAGVANLRLFTLWRITFAITAGEGFFKDEADVQLCAPAEALLIWANRKASAGSMQ